MVRLNKEAGTMSRNNAFVGGGKLRLNWPAERLFVTQKGWRILETIPGEKWSFFPDMCTIGI